MLRRVKEGNKKCRMGYDCIFVDGVKVYDCNSDTDNHKDPELAGLCGLCTTPWTPAQTPGVSVQTVCYRI